jgi:DNA mismatch repair protein PMS2
MLSLDRCAFYFGSPPSTDNLLCIQRGTTITLTNLFLPLPVRRKEFERNAKREFGKAMGLLTAYALVPCSGISGSVEEESGEEGGGMKTTGMKTMQRRS